MIVVGAESDRFLGAFAGVTGVKEYFAAGNALRILGQRGGQDRIRRIESPGQAA